MNYLISTLFVVVSLFVSSNALVCNFCNNCYYSPIQYQTCGAGQNYCYATTSGSVTNAGCAGTCVPGTNTRCCTSSYCNSIPGLLQCYTCDNCNYNFNALQTCAPGQNYCYKQISGTYVKKGCAATCLQGTNTRCCTRAGCNHSTSFMKLNSSHYLLLAVAALFQFRLKY